MDVSEILKQFCKEVFPEENIEIVVDKNVAEFEAFYPSVAQIIQKDNSFFNEDRVVFGRNLSSMDESLREVIWKNMVPCMIGCFFHGDIKQKVGSISEIIKNVWNASGQKNDAVTSVLNDEKSQGHFQEILDFVMNSRLVKIFTNLVESFDLSEFDLKIDSIAELIEMIKDPENPMVKKISQKIHNTIKEKIRRGEFTQQTIMMEVEAIKAKVIGLFGNIFNDALGGRKGDIPTETLMGNSPEARRQRMLARMQRKVREKNSK
jgi:hypothetical protein